jgi:hypothetical protein
MIYTRAAVDDGAVETRVEPYVCCVVPKRGGVRRRRMGRGGGRDKRKGEN